MKKFDFTALKKSLSNHSKIVFSFVFGSSQNGVINKPDSDIDIAVFLSEKPTPELLTEIIGICQDAVGYENVDIVLLNDSDPILAFQALSGKLLTCRDMDVYASFFSRTCRLHEDVMMRLKKQSA